MQYIHEENYKLFSNINDWYKFLLKHSTLNHVLYFHVPDYFLLSLVNKHYDKLFDPPLQISLGQHQDILHPPCHTSLSMCSSKTFIKNTPISFCPYLGSARGSMGLFPGGTAVAWYSLRVPSNIWEESAWQEVTGTYPDNFRVFEDQVVELTWVLSNVEEARLGAIAMSAAPAGHLLCGHANPGMGRLLAL